METRREIKFRKIYKCKNGHYTWGYLTIQKSIDNDGIRFTWGAKNCNCRSELYEGFSPYGDENEYIGLKDKNGKEIYEGDILKTDVGIYYIKTALPFIELVDKDDSPYENGDYYVGREPRYHDWKEFEVLGNIYENPELLK